MLIEEQRNFQVFPSIVPANEESEITIRAIDGRILFYDDITYDIQFIPSEESDVPIDDKLTLRGYELSRKTFSVRPQNGVIKIKYFFSDEQRWGIKISTQEYEKHENPLIAKIPTPIWQGIKKPPKDGVVLYIYSLYPDLYNKRVLRGNLHLHTNVSDGRESPVMAAARNRAAGLDFIAVTDHFLYDGGKAAREAFDFETDFKVLVGEEIHNTYVGNIHLVNIESSKSVNERFLSEPDVVDKEAMALESEVEIPEGVDKKEYLYRVWCYREAKKYGGLVIFPHPYWAIAHRYHVGPRMSMAILRNGLCDAFEVVGGPSEAKNNLQVALWSELRAEGKTIPVVGSTDGHTVLFKYFDSSSTYVFADGDDIKGAVLNGYSVAAEHQENTPVRLYGTFRLVRYARFLAEHYFPMHNDLCEASGNAITEYISGNKEMKPIVEALEKRVLDFEKKFFGRM